MPLFRERVSGMGIYIGIFILAVFAYLWGINHKKSYIFLMGLIFFIIIGFRSYSVGTDTLSYGRMFENSLSNVRYDLQHFPSVSFFSNDFLFFFLCAVLNMVGIPYRGFLIISSAIVTYSIFHLISKYSYEYMISATTFMTIGLMSVFMSAARQTLAIAFVMFAIPYLIEKKPIRYCLLVIVAAGFHITAIVMIPMYIVVNVMREKKPVWNLIFCVIFGVVFSGDFFALLNAMNLSVRFSSYLDNSIGTNPLLLIMYIGIAVVYILLRHTDIDATYDYRVDNVFFTLLSIGIGIVTLSLQNTMVSRLAYYCIAPLPIILSNSINHIKEPRGRIITIFMCLAIELVYLLYTTSGSTFGISNYSMF